MAGGIGSFAAEESNVRKWTLNRSEVANITHALKEFSGLKDSNIIYKHSRPTEIVKSNRMVLKVIDLNEYLDPFDEALDSEGLYNLSSGISLLDNLADGILEVLTHGKEAFKYFVKDRLTWEVKEFYAKLPKLKVKLFSQTSQKVQIKGKAKVIEDNSNVISKLLALSSKLNRKIDMQASLYPLSAVPLSLPHPDGSRKTTKKSVLTDILMESANAVVEQEYPDKENVSAYLIDLMALIRARHTTPPTFKEVAIPIIDTIPSGYKRVDIIADTYRPFPIKSP